MNRNQFAKALNVYYQQVLHWERGKAAPNLTHLVEIARSTGVSADWLLGLEDQSGEVPTTPRVVDEVLTEVGEQLADGSRALVRSIPWDANVSAGTIRSYVFDLMLAQKRAAEPTPRRKGK
jgi:transcriptional regulator with XRE-family HTH domain